MKTISIHAPLSGERPLLRQCMHSFADFNPRSPKRGATSFDLLSLSHMNFNPRSPKRGATTRAGRIMSAWSFQSTLP